MKKINQLQVVATMFVAAISLAGCVESTDDPLDGQVDDGDRSSCQTCRNGFSYALPTAAFNDLKAGFNHVMGNPKGVCTAVPSTPDDFLKACAAWGALFRKDTQVYSVVVADFVTVSSGLNPSCPAGFDQSYWVKYDARTGACAYSGSSSQPGAGWAIKCIDSYSAASPSDPQDYKCVTH